MPGKDLRVALRLTADGKGFVGELRVAQAELKRERGVKPMPRRPIWDTENRDPRNSE